MSCLKIEPVAPCYALGMTYGLRRASARRPTSVGATLPQRVVFVVEDDAAVLTSLRFFLETEGFAVRTYASGPALLSSRLPGPGDCLVVDYKMADMDGFELIDRLRALGVVSPAILVTAYPSAALAARARARGVQRIVLKPHIEDSLATHVRAAMKEAADLRNSP